MRDDPNHIFHRLRAILVDESEQTEMTNARREFAMNHQDINFDCGFHLGLTDINAVCNNPWETIHVENTLLFGEDNAACMTGNRNNNNNNNNNKYSDGIQPFPIGKRKRTLYERRGLNQSVTTSDGWLHNDHVNNNNNNNNNTIIHSSASCGQRLSPLPDKTRTQNPNHNVFSHYLMTRISDNSSFHRVECDEHHDHRQQQQQSGIPNSCLSSQNSSQSIPSLNSARVHSLPPNFLQHKQQLQLQSSSSASGGYSAKITTKQFIVDAIRDKFQAMLKGTSLKPDTEDVVLVNSDEVVPCSSSGSTCSFAGNNESLLGKGAFAQVTRVTLRRGWNGKRQYACKQLKREIVADSRAYIKAATELVYEAHVLGSLDHPNIVKLRGLSEGGIASFGNATCEAHEDYQQHASEKVLSPATSFFFLMDVLQETLDQRIERWKTVDRPRNNIQLHLRNIQKLSTCKQLACALDYIHSKGVVYRDLKPQNIGFCEETGNLKLFDFGLCRELPFSAESGTGSGTSNSNRNSSSNNNNNNRGRRRLHLSGVVGTMRYMAPEVCLHQPYNRDCDIYSWSIISWEILSQAKPFETFTPDIYLKLVCKQGVRPTDLPLNAKRRRSPSEGDYGAVTPVSEGLKELLKQAWQCKPQERIRLPIIQAQLDLFRNLEELRLAEERIQERMVVGPSPEPIISFASNTSAIWGIGTGVMGEPTGMLIGKPIFQSDGRSSANFNCEDACSPRKKLRSGDYQSSFSSLISLDSYGGMTQSNPSFPAARQCLVSHSTRSETPNAMVPLVDLWGSNSEEWMEHVGQ